MAKWKVITSEEEVVRPGIYQEKIIIAIGADAGDIQVLKDAVIKRKGELADVPQRIQRMADQLGLQVFAFWGNKTNPVTRIEDILEGNIRLQISDDE